jgi:methylmalonyl-CoA/ethylmalonyl-CoA epimerase
LINYLDFWAKFEFMILRLEHIGIAVKNIEESNNLFAKLLGIDHYKLEEVATENVLTSFFKSGETKIELLEPLSAESPIAKFIEKRGEGIHHIAFEVDDIISEMKRLENEGFVLINTIPKPGADKKIVCFFHPRSTNGVLIELCQTKQEID